MNKKGNKNKSIIKIIVIIVLLAIIAVVIAALIKRYTPSDETADLYAVFGLYADEENGTEDATDDEYAIVMQDYIATERALYYEDEIYLPFDLVKENFDERFYWDENEELLIFTNAEEVTETSLNSDIYTVDGTENTCDYDIVIESDGTVYVAIDYIVLLTSVEYSIYDNPNHVCITYKYEDTDVVTAEKDTVIRKLGGIKSPIVAEITEGEELTVLETLDEWTKVITEDGYIGYLKNSTISESTVKTLTTDYTEPEYTSLTMDEEICLAWDNLGGDLEDKTEDADCLNVVSPGWFAVSSVDGDVTSTADSSYVTTAHSLGYQVWAMIDDFSYSDNGEYIETTLASTTSRRNLINNIIELVEEYDLDGINIDFECIDSDFAEDYIQFLRELSIVCRENEIYLSADNYPPSEYREYYDLEEQATLLDYVIIMAYDNYVGTGTTGANSDVEFIQDILESLSDTVPESKTIIAIPFYTREWIITPEDLADEGSTIYDNEEYGNIALKTKTYYMSTAINKALDYADSMIWLDDLGMYYYEYTEDGSTHQIWLENAESIEQKLLTIEEYDIAGVAAWQLGFETSDVWEVMSEYIGN